MLTYKILLSVDEIKELWRSFGEAIGIDNLKSIYGSYWPRKPIKGEWVFAWYDGELVGWEAIRHDPVEPVMWAIGGVFPKHQNNGYATKIFNGTIREGFKIFPDVEWVRIEISKENTKFFGFLDRLEKETCRWSKVGEINVPPPGYTIFGLEKSKFEEA